MMYKMTNHLKRLTVLCGCLAATALAQPGNDLCEDAIRVALPSITAGTTIGATTDDAPFCGSAITSPGVWYSVIGTGHTLSADTCNGNTTYDSILTVYCGSCPELVCVGANDDFCESQSKISWCSEAGRTYFILVHGFEGDTGDFELSVSDDGAVPNPCDRPPTCERPSNDTCENAIDVVENTPFDGDTNGATGKDVTSCALNDVVDVWHRLRAGCDGIATVSLCDSEYDTTLALFDACAGEELACNDDKCDDRSKITLSVLEGSTRLIRVSGFNGALGAYTLLVTCEEANEGACCLPDGACRFGSAEDCSARGGQYHPGAACEEVDCPQPPPLNDDCADAIGVFEGQTAYDNIAAGTDGPPHAACDEFGSDQIGSDVWFVYQATGDQEVTISTCDDADYDTRLAAYVETDCPVNDDRLLDCNDDDPECEGFTSKISFATQCDQWYLIRAGGFREAQGTAVLSVTQTGVCAPPIECELIKRFKVKCRKQRLTVQVVSSLPGGTRLTIDNNGDLIEMILNDRGRGRLKLRDQTGEHTVSIVECPERSKVVDCGQ